MLLLLLLVESLAECYYQGNGFVDQQVITCQLLPKSFNRQLRIIKLGVILLNVTWFCANRRKNNRACGRNHTFLLTYLLHRASPSWEANWYSASQGIPCIWCNLDFIAVVTNARQLRLYPQTSISTGSPFQPPRGTFTPHNTHQETEKTLDVRCDKLRCGQWTNTWSNETTNSALAYRELCTVFSDC